MTLPTSAKHQPARLAAYFAAHYGKLKQLESIGLVLSSQDLLVEPAEPDPRTPFLKIKGPIHLADGLRMDVRKTLRVQRLPVLDTYNVYTISYSYSLVNPGSFLLFRYCGPHDDDDLEEGPSHHKFHHKHIFDPATGKQTEIKILTEDEWPTLGEALDEVSSFLE